MWEPRDRRILVTRPLYTAERKVSRFKSKKEKKYLRTVTNIIFTILVNKKAILGMHC